MLLVLLALSYLLDTTSQKHGRSYIRKKIKKLDNRFARHRQEDIQLALMETDKLVRYTGKLQDEGVWDGDFGTAFLQRRKSLQQICQKVRYEDDFEVSVPYARDIYRAIRSYLLHL